ncbi:MAG: hypothetical protein C4551_06525 [Bacillota bacterium]|nr:MAG: hypothetical protein C4551_06525 [Bacillota bacterium]
MIQAQYHGTTVNIPVTPEELRGSGRVYIGWRQPDDADEDGPQVWAVGPEPEQAQSVAHVLLHGKDIEWGYGGSRPADLALSILSHYLRSLLAEIYGDVDQASPSSRHEAYLSALDLHQVFKWRYVARFGHDRWTLPVVEIREWLGRMTQDLSTPERTRDFLRVLLGLTETEER